jgi:valyl-tRNA synthetase
MTREASAALSTYDHTGALEAIERFFWMFCDDYLELVKTRAYGDGGTGVGGAGDNAAGDGGTGDSLTGDSGAGDAGASARGTLRQALDVLLRLFAPFLPFVAEEAWSWWHDGSVHAAPWPSGEVTAGAGAGAGDPAVLATAAAVLGQVRKAKTAAKLSIRTEAARVIVRGPDEAVVRASEPDLRAAGNIADFSFEHAPELGTEVTLAESVAS